MATVSTTYWLAPSRLARANHFSAFMAGAIAALFCAELLLARLVNLSGMESVIGKAELICIATACAIVAMFTWLELPRLLESARLAALGLASMIALQPLSQIAARSPMPLQDANLGKIDSLLHFSTAGIVHALVSFPVLRDSLAFAYGLLPPMALAALVLPALLGHTVAARRYLLGVQIAVVATIALFAVFPAVGPWVANAFTPSPLQASVDSYLRLLKTDGPLRLGQGPGALVSFPSFHVALAVMSATALWSIRWARHVALILAVTICISTVTTGWHYGVDVVGGLLVAWGARSLATHWLTDADET